MYLLPIYYVKNYNLLFRANLPEVWVQSLRVYESAVTPTYWALGSGSSSPFLPFSPSRGIASLARRRNQ